MTPPPLGIAPERRGMGWLLGTDEAGYGPKLGPLVVAATLWEVPGDSLDALGAADLFQLLQAAVRAPSAGKSDGRLTIGDSKTLYGAGDSLAGLALPAAIALDLTTGQRGAEAFLRERLVDPNDAPWSPRGELVLDDVDSQARADGRRRLDECLKQAGVRLAAIDARVVYPPEFNAGCRDHGNKATFLSRTTLRLAADVLDRHVAGGPLVALCDKHGGRNDYAALLGAMLDAPSTGRGLFDAPGEATLRTLVEGRDRSAYRWDSPRGPREFRFSTQGERALPTALASMTAKLLRELAMGAFNAWWRMESPEVKPTAGYPGDAERFLADVAAARKRLGVADERLIRDR